MAFGEMIDSVNYIGKYEDKFYIIILIKRSFEYTGGLEIPFE